MANERLRTHEDFVNHRYIEESSIADHYVLGKLTPEEQAQFEEHFVDCQECLDRLETTGNFRRALKRAVAEDAAGWRVYTQVGLFAWLMRRNRWQRAGILITASLLLIVPTAFLVSKITRARAELEQARKASADWQRQYEDQQRATSGLEKELQEARINLREQRNQLETRSERELPRRADQGPINHVASQIGVPVFALSVVRSDESTNPTTRISIPRSTRSIVLSLELENNSEAQSFRVTVSTAANRIIWKGSNLKPHSSDMLRINLNTNLIQAGDYQLTLEGLTRDGRYIPEGKYSFRVNETPR